MCRCLSPSVPPLAPPLTVCWAAVSAASPFHVSSSYLLLFWFDACKDTHFFWDSSPRGEKSFKSYRFLTLLNLSRDSAEWASSSALAARRFPLFCLSKLKNAFSPPRILFSLLPPAELRSSSARLARPRTRGGRLLYQSLREKSFKSFKIIFIFVWFVGFGLSAFLLRTSAIQASLMALGLSSVLPRKGHSFSRVS